MSTQETGNTCYFQTYLFAVLCRVCAPSPNRDGSVDIHNQEKLADVTLRIASFLLEFFAKEGIMRPLTNNNFVLDFMRYKNARYYAVMTSYLRHRGVNVPDYEQQYEQVLRYYQDTKTLHTYCKCRVEGKMPGAPNTKQLQPVQGTDDGRYKLCMFNYYK